MDETPDIMSEYKTRFNEEASVAVSAPGRVNLIGEHTDYNRGWVLPMAVERRVWAAGAPLTGSIELSSEKMPETIKSTFPIKRTGTWADYPLGVLWVLHENGYSMPGVRMHFNGNVPLGGGLSSSAAIEVATTMVVSKMYNIPLSRKEIARLCQVAENQFVGMNCGAMDQMASALARDGYALHIDCGDLSFDYVPFEPGDYRVFIIDSGIGRELASSAYNQRRRECEQAVKLLGVRSLRELDEDDLERVDKLPEPINRRARHVVTENARVGKAVYCLVDSYLEEFGSLMIESHESLKTDYEVSVPQLDFLVEECSKLDGVLGARLTGAGFGGCVVVLAHLDAGPEMETKVMNTYGKKFDVTPTIMTTRPSEGARVEHTE